MAAASAAASGDSVSTFTLNAEPKKTGTRTAVMLIESPGRSSSRRSSSTASSSCVVEPPGSSAPTCGTQLNAIRRAKRRRLRTPRAPSKSTVSRESAPTARRPALATP